MHKRRRIERDLAAMKNRDEIIREAYAEGFLKKEIHQRSGVARTTIDRILKEKPVQITDITADTPSREAAVEAWVEAAARHGHGFTVVEADRYGGELVAVVRADNWANENDPTVGGDEYELRIQGSGTVTASLRTPTHKVTANSAATSPDWHPVTAAWLRVAREHGHDAQDTGETASDNAPVIRVGDTHYVLTRYYDRDRDHMVVHVDFKARKYNGAWTPTP